MVFAAGFARVVTYAAGQRHPGSFADRFREVDSDNPLGKLNNLTLPAVTL